MRKRNKIGITLLIIGGIMMIISSTLGSIGVYEFIYSWVTSNIPPDFDWLRPVLYVLLEILRWIANLGGGAVIIGAIVILLGSFRFGKWLVSIGLAFGTLTLIIWIITQVIPIRDIITDPVILGYIDRIASLVEVNTIFQIVGVVVAIVGRNFVKKPKKAKEEEIEEVEEVPEAREAIELEEQKEIESQPPIPFQNISCPNCGASVPFNANFCSECGTNFDEE
ncbi:MAG: zinc ribbon domain-containing protein [Promethearchaeota archaeon]